MKSRRVAPVIIALLLTLGTVFSGILFSGSKQIKAAEKIDGGETVSEEDKTINMKGLFEKIPAVNMQETAFCAWKARMSTKDEIEKVCAVLKTEEEAKTVGDYAEALALEKILRSRLTDRQMEALKAYEAFLYEYAKDFMEEVGKTFDDYEKNGEEAFMGAKFTLIYLDGDEIPELAVGGTALMSVPVYSFTRIKTGKSYRWEVRTPPMGVTARLDMWKKKAFCYPVMNAICKAIMTQTEWKGQKRSACYGSMNAGIRIPKKIRKKERGITLTG